MAGGPGFEPRLTGPEPDVLPLNYPPIISYYTTFYNIVNIIFNVKL